MLFCGKEKLFKSPNVKIFIEASEINALLSLAAGAGKHFPEKKLFKEYASRSKSSFNVARN